MQQEIPYVDEPSVGPGVLNGGKAAVTLATLARVALAQTGWGVALEGVAIAGVPIVGVSLPLLGFAGIMIGLGVPFMQAHALQREEGSRHGLAIGFASGLFKKGGAWVRREFRRNRPTGGFMMNAMRSDYPLAFNTALPIGHAIAWVMKPAERQAMVDFLKAEMQRTGMIGMLQRSPAERGKIEWHASAALGPVFQ